jgi:4-amino-4-deoxy-L-arabinose transferase-like glycosyltransferase
MQTIDGLEATQTTAPEPTSQGAGLGHLDRFQRRKLLVILVTFLIGLGARVYRLDASGLAEDEANKILAIRSYSHGDFSVNSEHPMLMKLLCFSSEELCARWNEGIGWRLNLIISEESALRLPNAIIGALTVIPLFLLASALFGFRVGWITACLWALGGNAIWFNRTVKEDSLLVLFMLSGYVIYNSAKNRPAWDVSGQERLYGLAGVAFGLMLCSKYFPHYYGLMALFYHLSGYDPRDNRPLTPRMRLIHGGAILLTFLAFNFAILLPDTWSYLWKYVHGDLFTHHGYIIMNHLYPNDMARTPNGSPWFFYALYLIVKVPPALTAAFLMGVVVVFRRRRSDYAGKGHLFLRIMLVFWLFPMSLLGVKFLRYTLALMPFYYMTAAVGAAMVWRTGLNAAKKTRNAERSWNSFRRFHGLLPTTLVGACYRVIGSLLAAGVFCVFVLGPAATALAYLPYPGLYTNAFGAGRVGYFFPHDEFYDLGARESIRYIADHAPAGALVASEVPAVLQYYLERYGRTDIESEIISHPRYDLASHPPDFVLLQPGRVYFENEKGIRVIESGSDLAESTEYGSALATRVYRTTLNREGAAPLKLDHLSTTQAR